MFRSLLSRLRPSETNARQVRPSGQAGQQPPVSPDLSADTQGLEDIERRRQEQEEAARQQQAAREHEQAVLDATFDRLLSKNSEDFMGQVRQHGGQ